MNRRHRRLFHALALSLAVVITASACSQQPPGGGSESPGTDKLEKVTIALSPFQDVFSTYIGVEKGWYKDAGIDLEISQVNWDTAQQLVAAGQTNLANGTDADVVLAAEQGRDVRFALPLYIFAANVLVTHEDSKVKTYDQRVEQGMSHEQAIKKTMNDLKGAQICLPPAGAQMAAFKLLVGLAGLKTTDFQLIEMTEEDGLAAFLGNSCDIYMGGVPQLTEALKHGAKIVVPQAATPTGAAEAGFVADGQWAATHAGTLERLQKVIFRQLSYIESNPDDGFRIISEHLAKAGTPLSPEDLKASWNNLELFPSSAETVTRDWICKSGDFYYKARWASVIEQNNSTVVTAKNVDHYFAARNIVESVLKSEGKSIAQTCGK